jgi:hypothetical protein
MIVFASVLMLIILFSANASTCLQCPDGFICTSGLLAGQKRPKKSLGAGLIAAIVVGSVFIGDSSDAWMFYDVTCVSVTLVACLCRRYYPSCTSACPTFSTFKISLPKYAGQHVEGRQSLLSDDGSAHTHPL